MRHIATKLSAFAFLIVLFIGLEISDVQAQGREKKQQGPPPWAPAHGYRAKTRHVYFPERNFYYDVQKGVYIYINNGRWEVSVKLPSFLSGYNLRSAAKVELDFAGDTPQQYNADHVSKYGAVTKGSSRKGNDEGTSRKNKGKNKPK